MEYQQQELSMNDSATSGSTIPRIGEPAPAFTARSTKGLVRLEDYKGKWLVLFSHPADFTPVCTTELVEFARRAPELEKLGVALLGVSIDSVYSHIAWLRSMTEHFDVEVPFPVIADMGMDVARKYGMVHPGASETATVRAVFVIGPEQKIRALVYYPLTTGRAVSEIVRLVQALQLNETHSLATPEGWQPGGPCIVPPPTTDAEAKERVSANGYQVTDWYLSHTECPA
jgi:peroxiredoxin (alkyl hydroperoxide reductase subunit C)